MQIFRNNRFDSYGILKEDQAGPSPFPGSLYTHRFQVNLLDKEYTDNE